MLKLTNENLNTLRAAAASIDPRDRGRYLEAVAQAMRDHPIPTVGNFTGSVTLFASRFRPARSDAGASSVIDGRS
jgi:hypothetical protein